MQIEMKDLAELLGAQQANETPFEVGKTYLIRTCTFFDVGVVKKVYPQFLVLGKATWVADTGRFSESLKDLKFSEQEPFVDDCIVSLGAIVDATPWLGDLPLSVK